MDTKVPEGAEMGQARGVPNKGCSPPQCPWGHLTMPLPSHLFLEFLEQEQVCRDKDEGTGEKSAISCGADVVRVRSGSGQGQALGGATRHYQMYPTPKMLEILSRWVLPAALESKLLHLSTPLRAQLSICSRAL